jgi:hypothetical protein
MKWFKSKKVNDEDIRKQIHSLLGIAHILVAAIIGWFAVVTIIEVVSFINEPKFTETYYNKGESRPWMYPQKRDIFVNENPGPPKSAYPLIPSACVVFLNISQGEYTLFRAQIYFGS